MKKSIYPGLDLFKFICAILILILYANPLVNNTIDGVILREIITPIAVPFFLWQVVFCGIVLI